LDGHQPIGRDMLQDFLRAAQPLHLDAIRLPGVAQAEVQSQVALRAEAAAAAHFLSLPLALPLHDDARTDGGTVRAGADELDEKPGIRGRRLVTQQRRPVVDVIDDQVDLTGVEDVTQGQPAAAARLEQACSAAVRDIFETAVAEVAEENLPAVVAQLRMTRVEARRIDRAGDDQDVGTAVVVKIEKGRSPLDGTAGRGEARLIGYVGEEPLTLVMVERWSLV
jgi:hypothetical protein